MGGLIALASGLCDLALVLWSVKWTETPAHKIGHTYPSKLVSSALASGIVDGTLVDSSFVCCRSSVRPSNASSDAELLRCLCAIRVVCLLAIWCGVWPLCSSCPSSVQPAGEKLPFLISPMVGTLDAISPVASHMPYGGLLLRNEFAIDWLTLLRLGLALVDVVC